jgi:hypothetical protein
MEEIIITTTIGITAATIQAAGISIETPPPIPIMFPPTIIITPVTAMIIAVTIIMGAIAPLSIKQTPASIITIRRRARPTIRRYQA